MSRNTDSDHAKCDGHGHVHRPDRFGNAFAIGIALNLGFVLLEVVYGIFAHSLALVADAGHNMSDVLGLLLRGRQLFSRESRLRSAIPTDLEASQF